MKLRELFQGHRVRARWGRAGESSPNWGPWKEVGLYVERAGKDQKIVCLGMMELNLNFIPWAEYAEDDFDPKYKVFLVEDYYLEIEGLEP